MPDGKPESAHQEAHQTGTRYVALSLDQLLALVARVLAGERDPDLSGLTPEVAEAMRRMSAG